MCFKVSIFFVLLFIRAHITPQKQQQQQQVNIVREQECRNFFIKYIKKEILFRTTKGETAMQKKQKDN
jgi:hypothetical protein